MPLGIATMCKGEAEGESFTMDDVYTFQLLRGLFCNSYIIGWGKDDVRGQTQADQCCEPVNELLNGKVQVSWKL